MAQNETKMMLKAADAESFLKAHPAAVSELLDPARPRANVVGVATGVKWKNGEATGEPAVLVLVAQKLTKDQLGSADVVPTKLQDMQTDVLAVGYPFAGGEPGEAGVRCCASRSRSRFSKGGDDMKTRFERVRRIVVMTMGLYLTAAPAIAGIVDSPLPELEAGKRTSHVYSVPGIIASGGLGTHFRCTSTDAATMRVGVELFFGFGGAPANDAVATSLSVAPGATVRFATSAAAGLSIDSSLGFGGSSNGSARILATSRKLICTVFVADTFNVPPVTTWQLTIVKQKTQKGD